LPEKQVIWKAHFYGNKLVAQEHALNEAIISAPTHQLFLVIVFPRVLMQKATHSALPALRRPTTNFILKQKNLIYRLTPYSLRSILIVLIHSRASQELFPSEVSEICK
jgi:hypothetical protein